MDKQKDFEKGWEEYKAKYNKETEELEKDISKDLQGVLKTEIKSLARFLHKIGYHKIPKNAVVLTREEYETYTFIKRKWGNQDAIKWSELVDGLYEFAREFSKETVKKFIKDLDYFIGHMKPSEYSLMEAILAINAKAYKIANKFGVYYEDET